MNKLDLRLCSARFQNDLDFILSHSQSPVLGFDQSIGFAPSLHLGPRPCLVLGLGPGLGPDLGPGLGPNVGPVKFLV